MYFLPTSSLTINNNKLVYGFDLELIFYVSIDILVAKQVYVYEGYGYDETGYELTVIQVYHT